MKMNLKQGIAVMIGVAAVGIVGAQMIEYGNYDAALIPEPEGTLSAADMTSEPMDTAIALTPGETVVTMPEPIVAAPEPAPAIQAAAPVRTAPVLIELPRSVSPRSGEGSGEEIATRTAPVDERSASPLYQVDQSPGL